jgi:hypothetical protein
MGGGGQLALNQLLVVMDGIDNPPFFRRFWTNVTNNFLDAGFIIPRRVGRVALRIAPPRPRKDRSTSSARRTCRCPPSTRR